MKRGQWQRLLRMQELTEQSLASSANLSARSLAEVDNRITRTREDMCYPTRLQTKEYVGALEVAINSVSHSYARMAIDALEVLRDKYALKSDEAHALYRASQLRLRQFESIHQFVIDSDKRLSTHREQAEADDRFASQFAARRSIETR